MHQVLTDLWQTRTDSPFPGLTTHAFLWTGATRCSIRPPATPTSRPSRNSAASPTSTCRTATRPARCWRGSPTGSTRRCTRPSAELLEIGQHAHVDVPLGSRHVDVNGVEVIPTPGHSPGSTCYLVDGAEGRYLFTGDTLVLGESGDWWAGYIPGIGDADALATSLRLLRTLDSRRGDLQRIPRRLGRAPDRAWPLAGARRPGSRRACPRV